MKKIILSLFALATTITAFSTDAFALGSASGAGVAPMLVLPTRPSSQPIVLDCAAELGKAIEAMKQPHYSSNVDATSTLLVGSTAYAESCGSSSGGFCENDGTATHSGEAIAGTSQVGSPVSTNRSPLTFRIFEDSGKARIKWTFGGKSRTGAVNSCAGRIWTATSGGAAIAIHLAEPQKIAQ